MDLILKDSGLLKRCTALCTNAAMHAAIRPHTHAHTYLSASPPFLRPHKLDQLSHDGGRERFDSCLSDRSGAGEATAGEDHGLAHRYCPVLQLHGPAGRLKRCFAHSSTGMIGRPGAAAGGGTLTICDTNLSWQTEGEVAYETEHKKTEMMAEV